MLSVRHNGLSLREIAAEMGVSDRTIRRDLAVFRDVGFPLEEEVGDLGIKTWRIRGGREQPAMSFTFEEAAALYLGRRLLEPLSGTLLWEAAHSASKKIQASLDRKVLDYLDEFATYFHQTGVGGANYRIKADLIDGLLVAAEDGSRCRLSYRSERATNPSTRDVDPYGFVDHRGALYLVARDVNKDAIRHYKVDRIESVEATSTKFTRPEGFDLTKHLSSAFGVYLGGEPVDVEVRFDHSVARYVREAQNRRSQGLTTLADGAVLARFTVSGTEELKRWVLGFGAKAVILEPEWLRLEVIEELARMAAEYAVAGERRDTTKTDLTAITAAMTSLPDRALAGLRATPER